MQNNTKAWICFLVILSVFTFGLVKLFALRFETGDIYSPYSSLRSDPLGTRGIYDSLGNLGTVDVERNYLPIHKLGEGHDTTLFCLGITPVYDDLIPEPTFGALDRFVRTGGRLVITFLPVTKESCTNGEDESEKNETDTPEGKNDSEKVSKADDSDKPETTDAQEEADQQKKDDSEKEDDTYAFKKVSMSEKWEFAYETENPDHKMEAVGDDDIKNEPAPMSSSVSWHSKMRFAELADGWEVIYRIDGKPVIIEKKHGQGSLVFASDSYFISNEALKKERHPALLAWLAGINRRMIFDESHLGISKNPGTATLIRKYNLHGLVASLFLFAVLFVWKNSSGFIPPTEADPKGYAGTLVSARDHSSGLASLLRRNIGKKKLLDACIAEWRKTFISDNEASERYENILEEINATINVKDGESSGDVDSVNGYARICRIISKKE